MEDLLNQQTGPVSGTIQTLSEFTTTYFVNRRPLRDWGYEQAGLNRGDATALESHLRCIKEGHLVDATYSADDEIQRKKQIESQIVEKEKEKDGKEKDITYLKEVIIPEKEQRIADYKEEIEQKKISMAEGTIQSQYNAGRFWLYLTLCVFISVYLLFFYASAINAAFFRSMQQLVNNNSGDDITLMLNSIFDVNALAHFGPQSIFNYLGAFFFFGLGSLPHILNHENGKLGWLKVGVACKSR